MNHYPKHLGDYAKDTAHLSMLEHGAFNLLIDWYYASEQPISADKAYRVAKAVTKAERSAVDSVLAEFFTKDGDRWANKRCDEEIAKYREKSRKASASAGARWSGCERNANASSNGMRTHMRTHSEGNASQEPIANNQEPNPQANAVPPDRGEPSVAGTVCARLRSEAGMVNTNPSDARLIAALANGVPPDLIVAVAKEFPRKNLAYVVATATGRHNDAASQAAGATHGNHTARPGRRDTALDRARRDNDEHRQRREGGGLVIEH